MTEKKELNLPVRIKIYEIIIFVCSLIVTRTRKNQSE